MKKLLEDNAETIDSQNQELIKLTSMIQKMDAMAIQQRNEYEQVINERDILGTQLIRRNDELALLAEKLKVPPGRLLASPLFLSSSLPRYPPLRPRPPTGGAFSGAAEDDLQGRDRVPRAAGGRAGAQAALQRTAARPIHPQVSVEQPGGAAGRGVFAAA